MTGVSKAESRIGRRAWPWGAIGTAILATLFVLASPAAAQYDDAQPLNEAEQRALALAERTATYARIDEACADGCKTSDELLHATALVSPFGTVEGAFELDIYRVQDRPTKYTFHMLDRFVPYCILIEADEDVMYTLLNSPVWKQRKVAPDSDEIVVARVKGPPVAVNLESINARFAGRRVVVKGTARLVRFRGPAQFAGSYQVRIRLEDASDLILVPEEPRP